MSVGCSAPDRPPELATLESTQPPVDGGLPFLTGLEAGQMDAPGDARHPGDAADGGDAGEGGGILGTCRSVDGGCASFVDCSPKVTVMETGASAPTAMGGVVGDGTYVLTDLTLYAGTGGTAKTPLSAWFRQTLRVTTILGGSADAGGGLDASPDADVEAGVTYDASGDAGPLPIRIALEEAAETDQQSLATLSGTITTQGDQLIIDYACPPSQAAFAAQYTSTGAALLMFNSLTLNGIPETQVATYTKI